MRRSVKTIMKSAFIAAMFLFVGCGGGEDAPEIGGTSSSSSSSSTSSSSSSSSSSSTSSSSSSSAASSSSSSGDLAAFAAQVYQGQCAICHGNSGEGRTNVGPRLTVEWQRSALRDEVLNMVNTNNTNCTPYATDTCVDALTQFILDDFALASGESPFACTQPLPAVGVDVKRLSHVEYQNTVFDVLSSRLDNSLANQVVYDENWGVARLVPGDHHETGMKEMDTRVSLDYVEGWFTFSLHLVEAVMPRLSEFVGESCAQDAGDKDCMGRFLATAGTRFFRKPLTDEQVAHYLTASSYRELLVRLFNAPDFIYHTEFNGEDANADGSVRQLSPHELAARLAYTYWQAPPDTDLLAAAASGEIVTDYDAVLDRVIANAKSRSGLETFFDDWWEVDHITVPSESLTRGLRQIDTDPSAEIDNSMPLQFDNIAYRDAAIAELRSLAEYVVWEQEGQLGDLYTDTHSFAQSQALAAAYGVPVWNGRFDALVNLPSGQRNGLLTRAGMHIFGGSRSNPILKGARIRKRLLCDIIPLPADNTPPDVNPQPDWTTRQLITAQTESTPGCAGCHQSVINPPGFATEDYDVLGRFRSDEWFVSVDGADNPVIEQQVSLDMSVQPQINGAGDTQVISSGVSLGPIMAQSDKSSQCFARMAFRHTFSRLESDSEDGCVLQNLASSAHSQTLQQAFKSIAEQPEFKLRRVSE